MFILRAKSAIRVLLVIAAMFLVVHGGGIARAHGPDKAKHILILHSYHLGLPWTDQMMAGMQEVLSKSDPPVHVDVEYLDTKRHRDSEYFYHILDAILHYKFKDRSYDLVLVTENDALKFAVEHRNDLFKGTPVVFCGVNSNNPALLQKPETMTGVLSDPDFTGVIGQALALQPDVQKLVVVGSTQELTDRLNLEQLKEIIRKRISFEYWDDLSDTELSTRLALLKPNTVILVSGSIRDHAGNLLYFKEQMHLLRNSTELPIYSFWDYYVGEGVVGGPLVSAKLQGKAAAELALRVLAGENPSDIPLMPAPAASPIYDYKELVRLGIPFQKIPPGSVLVNQPPSSYEVTKSQFWSTVMILLLSVSITIVLAWTIRQRHKAQAKLQLSEQNYRQLSQQFEVILNGIPDGLTLISPDMEVVWSNKGAGLYFNRTLGSIPGEYCCKLLYNRASLCDNCPAVSAFQTGDNEEAVIRTPDGRVLEVKAFPLKGQNGAIENVIMLASDITEKNRLMEETVRSRRLASLGELAAGVAHEINNPNALILFNSDLIRNACADILPILDVHWKNTGNFRVGSFTYEEMRQEIPCLISEMFDGASRIKRIVEDLKNFARADGPDVSERVDINEAVEASIRLVGNAIKNATDHLSVDLARSLPPFQGNVQRIEQVIVNLIMNACQALPDKSKVISISTGYDHERQACVVKVADEGVGIPKENMEHVTDPFFTTKRQLGGTGLGLSVSMRIIKDYGGGLEFLSAVNQGTIASLYLPAPQEIMRDE